ncbi:hypothetical protein BC828DRAFT_401779 [Blastocladiella britannica]|nr:hypothetical protein BC828DRAFT_401779 [Blastocladiella britannica]
MIDHVAHLILERAAGAARSPEAALAILNVLPQSYNPTVLVAALSRGFSEFRPAFAVEHGHGHLLPLYPRHVLFGNLDYTINAAANMADLPTLIRLWELAGPLTLGRTTWIDTGFLGLQYCAFTKGYLEILDWFVDATRAANLCIAWDRFHWSSAARKGNTRAIFWALEHGYLVAVTPNLALMAATAGDLTLLEHWIASVPDEQSAFASLKRNTYYPQLLDSTSTAALNWWWIHLANSSDLPDPKKFATIVEKALCNDSTDILEWWWARFLEHRTLALAAFALVGHALGQNPG